MNFRFMVRAMLIGSKMPGKNLMAPSHHGIHIKKTLPKG